MQFFKWDNTYSVNHDVIDKHHKTLFGIFNTLLGVLDVKGDVNTFKSVIDDLVLYSDYHFKAEEQYMQKVGYKDIERHMALHKYFTERLLT
jgi:hemerythrin